MELTVDAAAAAAGSSPPPHDSSMHHLVVGSSGTYVAEPASTLTSGAALQVVGAGAGSTSRSTSPRHAMGGSGGAPPPRGSLSRSSSGSSKRPQSGAGLEQRARYVAQLCQEKPELVKLNIGGTRYTTTKATLTRLEDSFFKALLDGDIPSTLDDQGAYFIDREGRYFEPILNYMRTGELLIPPSMPKSAVLAEADFYCITPVVASLQLEESDACGGKLFNALLRPWDDVNPVGDGWTQDFKAEFPVATEGDIEHVAFFSQGSRLGHVAILSLASLSLRVLSTAPHGISSACHDTLHIASYCCSAGVIYQLMIGHNDNTCLQELYKDPNNEEITVIVNREQRTLFYGTANGTLRRLDFPSSEIGGTCQSTLLQSGHVHPVKELLPLGNRTLVSSCAAGHVRCWNNYDVAQMNSYSIPAGALLMAPYLLQAQEDRVHIYDVLSGKMLHTLHAVNGSHVTALCVCHDKSFFGGMLLVTAHYDGTLQLWSLGLLSLLLREQHQASPHPPKKT
ncbi:K+ channel tetramerization subfamily protein [Acanthamoeba castellanii str. Neff]|uniref:K+ channel tetramerisation subfamily protein n=1 Tax=Acanthamoeba castellanii (strain ATCC 30010 / Neff) TaxID=1257118 RepID=M0QSG3_ACACF|nr:K+ channel tetramerization subfamily protein [Acanthamoeba castellanii str. Neff]ELR24748.1 K+ channel tetramerisation subfamily protein [Acanthamoeba castellanii str. Neff]